MITVISKRYETLTDEFIQQWLYDLVRDYQVEPEYLLVSHEGQRALRRLVAEDIRLYHWAVDYMDVDQRDKAERAERYPNKITGNALTIVVFPGLPEKTLCLASMLKMVSEEVEVKGATRVVTRSYDRQWD